MNAALQLVPPYKSPTEKTLEAHAVDGEHFVELAKLSELSPEQLLQGRLDELQDLVVYLRERLTLTQWDISQKETLLHSCLHHELELRIALRGNGVIEPSDEVCKASR